MKKLGILITVLVMASMLLARDRYEGSSGTADINDTAYGDWMVSNTTEVISMDKLHDKIEALDPNAHDMVTLDVNATSVMDLTGQEIGVDLATPANGKTGYLSTADQIYDWVIGLLSNYLESATHLAAYDHNDIATALQSGDIGSVIQAYDANLPAFPADPDADKYLKWDDTNSVLEWADAGSGSGDMLKEDYDVGDDGNVDGNDAEYDADTWDGDVNAPSKNATRDKIEQLYTGTLTPVDSNTITWDIDDVNHTVTLNVDPNYVGGGSGDAVELMDAHLVAFDHNDIAGHKHLSFSILDPNNVYDSNTVFPVCVKLPWAITIYSVTAACDKNPATELDWDLWFSANSLLQTPTKVIALDTTAGELSVNSGWNDNTVDVNSYFFVMFAARPDATIDDIAVDIEFSRASVPYSYQEVTVIEPNEAYDINDLVPVMYASKAITIDQVIFDCDKNPTAEPNVTLCFADSRISKANETVICEIDTTDGTVTVTSGWTDNTVPAGKWIYYKNNERPDADLDNSTIQLRYSYD